MVIIMKIVMAIRIITMIIIRLKKIMQWLLRHIIQDIFNVKCLNNDVN